MRCGNVPVRRWAILMQSCLCGSLRRRDRCHGTGCMQSWNLPSFLWPIQLHGRKSRALCRRSGSHVTVAMQCGVLPTRLRSVDLSSQPGALRCIHGARRLRRTALQGPTIRSARAPPQRHACRRTRASMLRWAPLARSSALRDPSPPTRARRPAPSRTADTMSPPPGQRRRSDARQGPTFPRGNDDLADCIISPVGHYVSTTGQASATPCPGGTYNNNTGSTTLSDCIPVGPGQYAPPGSSAPQGCQAGYYAASGGGGACTCRRSRVLCPNSEPNLSDRMFGWDVCAQLRPDLMRYHSARALQPVASGLEHPPMLERDLPTHRGPNRMLGRRSGVLRARSGLRSLRPCALEVRTNPTQERKGVSNASAGNYTPNVPRPK